MSQLRQVPPLRMAGISPTGGRANLAGMRSGGSHPSGGQAPRVGALAPHGTITPISDVAVAVLAACCTALDADGTICARVPELAQRAGLSLRTVERGLAELVTAGLVHARGHTRACYRYVDARVRKALQMPAGRRTQDTGWRELRARCGGFERALRASMRREKEARAYAAALAARREEGPSLSALAGHARIDAHLRAEGLHALGCIDGPDHCDRCAQFRALLEDGTREEAAEAAQLHLEEAADIAKAAAAVVATFRAPDHGARAQALLELERLVAR